MFTISDLIILVVEVNILYCRLVKSEPFIARRASLEIGSLLHYCLIVLAEQLELIAFRFLVSYHSRSNPWQCLSWYKSHQQFALTVEWQFWLAYRSMVVVELKRMLEHLPSCLPYMVKACLAFLPWSLHQGLPFPSLVVGRFLDRSLKCPNPSYFSHHTSSLMACHSHPWIGQAWEEPSFKVMVVLILDRHVRKSIWLHRGNSFQYSNLNFNVKIPI